ncbi:MULTISPECIES: heavy metal-binding domain-containing protein [Cytobacillus]|uniref:heavy metal-binding domain-containing protein n=1 Tax=Cytobacillus TaxID=2675230 RepID=UPI00203E5B9A|nr:heavy metal-binding domain-containing protein [Cytobacillus kochii]MCM3323311.1 heavy metal-binding domain-containing protein [Cytobacillus kochii]MCM3345706.1 heavy metal-binding domain-containing protein [Cytobacillus kochii]
MIMSTGDIKEKYEVLDVYHNYITTPVKENKLISFTKEKDLISEAFNKINLQVMEYAESMGGDGVIHIRYDTKFFNQDKNVMVSGYGTVIKLID